MRFENIGEASAFHNNYYLIMRYLRHKDGQYFEQEVIDIFFDNITAEIGLAQLSGKNSGDIIYIRILQGSGKLGQ